ncbi:MAG: excinuclease ABC subunit UvrA, partial [Pirellulaceae bacterium]
MNRLPAPDPATGVIQLRGVRVNNLKNIDLDIPHGQLLTLCGLSGSGKTSLALDTLFAEGQRRYIECFSPYTRQFLHQLEKPEADAIHGIPPAIAVTASRKSGNARTTVGTVTEIIEFLRLLFAQTAQLVCPGCSEDVNRSTPQDVVREISNAEIGTRIQIAFPVTWQSVDERDAKVADLRRQGFRRVVVNDTSVDIDQLGDLPQQPDATMEVLVIVDRLKTGEQSTSRCIESLETAFFYGHGSASVLLESAADSPEHRTWLIDATAWQRRDFRNRLICTNCDREFADPETPLFSFNSPLGACPECEGFGSVHFLDRDKIVPDSSLTLREGAIAPWNSPAYSHELDELIALADQHNLPLDVPFSELTRRHLDLIWQGDRANDFGGLNGFFLWLEKRKYKMHLRIFLARWRSYRHCPTCHGQRLNETALAWRVRGLNIAEWAATPLDELTPLLEKQLSSDSDDRPRQQLIGQIGDRLRYLSETGVGYLTLDRPLRTLSAGERQRVALTRALGSTLVNLLYVVDEPSSGLHPDDVQKLLPQIQELHRRHNTVVIVDHDPEIITLGQRTVELGPQAGRSGGEIVFDGSPNDLAHQDTPTGQFLAGERGFSFSAEGRRDATRGKLKLIG